MGMARGRERRMGEGGLSQPFPLFFRFILINEIS
jgi:hypothetical protein